MSTSRYGTTAIAHIIAQAGHHVYFPRVPGTWAWDDATDTARLNWTRTARVIGAWAERVPVACITEGRVAHALHAAWIVTGVRFQQRPRREFFAWAREEEKQRACYADAARMLTPILRTRHERAQSARPATQRERRKDGAA